MCVRSANGAPVNVYSILFSSTRACPLPLSAYVSVLGLRFSSDMTVYGSLLGASASKKRVVSSPLVIRNP